MTLQMPYKFSFVLLLFVLAPISCKSLKTETAYTSEALKIISITKNAFLHISYLDTDSFGKVACNGLIYMKEGEAIVFDTPVANATSEELIRWITTSQKHQITAVVVNHFHDDCLGGLEPFHQRNIPSYANEKTLILAQKEGNQIPKIGFDGQMELKIGNTTVSNQFVGEAHTRDNIVSYIAGEQLLFGGCMVKSLNADKGYLGDANEAEWSNTIEKIKRLYPEVKMVIPGHGDVGGTELLDYTAKLFAAENAVNNK